MLWCGSQARGLLRPFLLPVQRDPLGSQALTPGGTSPAAFHQEAAPASRRSPWEPGVLWTWLVLPRNKARQAPALTFHEDPSIKANFPKDGDLGTWPAPRRASAGSASGRPTASSSSHSSLHRGRLKANRKFCLKENQTTSEPGGVCRFTQEQVSRTKVHKG